MKKRTVFFIFLTTIQLYAQGDFDFLSQGENYKHSEGPLENQKKASWRIMILGSIFDPQELPLYFYTNNIFNMSHLTGKWFLEKNDTEQLHLTFDYNPNFLITAKKYPLPAGVSIPDEMRWVKGFYNIEGIHGEKKEKLSQSQEDEGEQIYFLESKDTPFKPLRSDNENAKVIQAYDEIIQMLKRPGENNGDNESCLIMKEKKKEFEKKQYQSWPVDETTSPINKNFLLVVHGSNFYDPESSAEKGIKEQIEKFKEKELMRISLIDHKSLESDNSNYYVQKDMNKTFSSLSGEHTFPINFNTVNAITIAGGIGGFCHFVAIRDSIQQFLKSASLNDEQNKSLIIKIPMNAVYVQPDFSEKFKYHKGSFNLIEKLNFLSSEEEKKEYILSILLRLDKENKKLDKPSSEGLFQSEVDLNSINFKVLIGDQRIYSLKPEQKKAPKIKIVFE